MLLLSSSGYADSSLRRSRNGCQGTLLQDEGAATHTLSNTRGRASVVAEEAFRRRGSDYAQVSVKPLQFELAVDLLQCFCADLQGYLACEHFNVQTQILYPVHVYQL